MDAVSENRPNSACLTSLMVACQQGLEFDVRAILKRKPGAVDQRDRSGKTALHYCAENSTLACAEQILSAVPGLVNVQDDEGYSPLHLAVISGNRSMARFLIKKGADFSSVDSEKHSCVHWATVCGEIECLDLLIDVGANPSTPDIHGAYPVHYAAQMCGPNSEMGNNVRLGLAVLRRLLARGVDVNCQDQDGRQPLLWAASAETRASKTYCPSGSSDAILALVNAGAKVTAEDKDGLTALHCAASRGHLDCLETLITLCGAEVDVVDSNGCSALFYAVTLGHADCTHLLLKFGAQANRQDKKGRTPAHCGAAKGQLETLKILSQHGANLWLRNIRGDMPLHEAIQSGRKDLVQWLLSQQQGSVNVSNSHGRTPMHIAAITNNVEMCKVLMDHGAFVNPIMRNTKGQLLTPLDAALHRGNRGCAKYLQLHGAFPASKLVERNDYGNGRSMNGGVDADAGSLESIPERRELRESAVQTETSRAHRDADVQVHFAGRIKNSPGEHTIRELRQEFTEQNRYGESHASRSGKPIIAKVYVHTKRSRDRRTSRRYDDTKDCQDSKKASCKEGSGDVRRMADNRCTDKSCSGIPRKIYPGPSEGTDNAREYSKYNNTTVVKDDTLTKPMENGTHFETSAQSQVHKDWERRHDTSATDSKGQGCDCCSRTGTVNCSCSCHENRELLTTKSTEESAQKEKIRDLISDLENQSPLSSIRSMESNVKDSGFSDDLDRDNGDASSEGEDHPSAEYRRKRKPVVRYLVSSGAADTFRFEEEDEENAGTNPPRASSMPTLQEKEEKIQGCHRLLTRPTVTKEIQRSLRKYQMERRLFHELQELKRQQILGANSDQLTTVKKLVERFRRLVLSPGMKDFQGPFTFRAFEKYLYEQLRRLSMTGKIPKPRVAVETPQRSYATSTEPSSNPALCVCRTHKCHHATEAYTGRSVQWNKSETARQGVLPEIPPPASTPHRPFPSKIPVSRSQSWDRLQSTMNAPLTYPPKLNGIISSSLPALTIPLPRKVPISLLAAIGQRLGQDVHPDDTVIIEMSAEDVPSKLQHAFTVREIREAVKQYEAAGGKLRPFPLESVLDPEDDGPVTFEIRHGKEKNVFRLPSDKLKDNKKWQVTFTIGKGRGKTRMTCR